MLRLEYELRKREMTQTALSDASGVNRVKINRILRGHEKAWPKWRDAISRALDWPLDKADQLFEEVQVS